jgi:hypothetical protein
MQDYWIDMALAVLFSALKSAVKNTQSKVNMKKAFLKLYMAIKNLYAGDEDFA